MSKSEKRDPNRPKVRRSKENPIPKWEIVEPPGGLKFDDATLLTIGRLLFPELFGPSPLGDLLRVNRSNSGSLEGGPSAARRSRPPKDRPRFEGGDRSGRYSAMSEVYLTRMGRSVLADEVFFAWSSADLERMLRARSLRTNPIDRHFLLLGIVQATYGRRREPEMRRLCRETAVRHIAEFPSILRPLVEDLGTLPHVPTFEHLATVLTEDGEFQAAVAVCEQALAFGLHDGTKGDYQGRIERIRKKACRSRGA